MGMATQGRCKYHLCPQNINPNSACGTHHVAETGEPGQIMGQTNGVRSCKTCAAHGVSEKPTKTACSQVGGGEGSVLTLWERALRCSSASKPISASSWLVLQPELREPRRRCGRWRILVPPSVEAARRARRWSHVGARRAVGHWSRWSPHSRSHPDPHPNPDSAVRGSRVEARGL